MCAEKEEEKGEGSLAAGRPILPHSLLLQDDEDGDSNRAEVAGKWEPFFPFLQTQYIILPYL
jgi:hypothetical protein